MSTEESSNDEQKKETLSNQGDEKEIVLEDETTTEESQDENQPLSQQKVIEKIDEGEEPEEEEKGPRFKLVIRNISIRNCTTESPKIRFTFGGNFKVVDNRHKGGEIETVGTKGKTFTTGSCEASEGGSGGFFKNEFIKYKRFKNYEEIAEQELTIELIKAGCCKVSVQGSAKINLLELANGHIQREVQTEIHQKGNHKITAKVAFHCYFQEIWNFDLHFYQFQGKNLLGPKQDNPPDPQIKLKINTKFMNFFKSDKNFQDRSCTSEHELNTNDPMWEEIGNITYRGIFSELENEDLLCKVSDHSTLKKSTEIGQSLIEMRGFLDYGILEGPLVLTQSRNVKNESTGNKEKQVTKTEGGSILGLVEVDELPSHQQYGDIVILKPGRNYIGVKISRCTNLRSADQNGFSDPFVIVEFGGFKQRTKVIYRSLDPVFEETLYFSIKVGLLTEQNIGKKGNVKVMVFDYDEAGDDFLGSCEIELKDIVKSPEGKAGNEFNKCTSRVLSERYNLIYNGEETEQSIDLKAWFQPDVPQEFTFENVEKALTKKKLSKSYRKREQIWRQKIPKSSLEKGEFEIAGADENYCENFIPTYMFKMDLPRDLRDRQSIARTVKCFTYENDEITFGGRRDVWCSPNFFLSLMKGSAEEHAALHVSMLLGLDIDAYLCQGKTKTGDVHYWVMIREDNGDITFCECSTNKEYHLEKKWKGREEEIELDIDKRKKNKKKKKKKMKNEKVQVDSEDSDELEKSQDEKNEKKEKKIQLEGSDSENDDDEEEEEEEEEIKDELIIPYMTIEIIANHQNLWGNVQESLNPVDLTFDLENNKLWNPFVDPEDGFTKDVKPFYEPSRLGPRIPVGRAKLFANRIRKEVIAGYTNFRHGQNKKTIFLKKFTPVIESDLAYFEKQAMGVLTEEEEKKHKIWAGKVAELCPQGYKFQGYTINFTYTDPTRIRNYIMDKYEHHLDEDKDTVFACGAFVQGYFGRVSSVWVMICIMRVNTPLESNGKEEEKKDEKKSKKKNEKKGKATKSDKSVKSEKKITNVDSKKPKKKKKKNQTAKVPLLSDNSTDDELEKD
ncbi:centrosomal protein of 76 kda [Anaeramoeba flamelloides]|uniref:Centrosomal protein of 76 kDa n=1 Tax=Anaeramoeba flamelloides TaxID=1746091 RepID=A0AAV8AA67_9EUKA|nr:centrosomal protein of 76 kda [Anaeramoeba flamelloides]